MKMLTKIEQLDQRFPGLADQVRDWFDQGVSVLKVAELLFHQYNVCVPRATLGNFRARRWAREREISRERRITALAWEELLRELEMKGSPAASTAPILANLTSFFRTDKDGRLRPIAGSLIEVCGRLPKK